MSTVLRAAARISSLTLLSRVLGFVRDMMMLRALGTSWMMGTFILAWMFPNMLRRLVGDGALAAAFIPSFSATLDREGKPAARSLLASVTGPVVVVLCGLTAVVLLLCWLLPGSLIGNATGDGASAAETGGLLLLLTAILFPYLILISLVAIYSGALNSLNRFAWPAALSSILNVFWIVGLLVGMHYADGDAAVVTTVTAGFLLFAGFVQLLIPLALLRRLHCLPRPRWPGPGDPARAVFVNMLPIVVGMSLMQINALVDQGFAYYLIEPGANTHVYLANRLTSFPHALTTVALATAVFPQFSRLASREQLTTLRDQAAGSLQMNLFITVPASVGMIMVAPDFIELFFASDQFTANDVRWSTLTTGCLVAGLPFMGAVQLYTRALYAMGETRSPARIAFLLVPLNLGLNAVFLFGFDLGVAGLTLATSVGAVINTAMLRRKFQEVCGHAGPVWLPTGRAVLATTLMAAGVFGCQNLIEAGSTLEVIAYRLALPIAAGIAIYAGTQWLTGSAELKRLARRLRS